ncbi:MAG: translocation/assembly module TamB domain-containing protein [Planctomycetes bacterium]|nr:translocation/assembly module TamB domain-containing protein [Planctomycetota bacterium]
MTTDPQSSRRPAPRWLRRTLRVLLIGLSALLVLLVIVWCFRRQLLVPVLRPRLEAMIRQAVQAERVSIGAVGGDWLTGIEVGDLEIAGAAAPPMSLRGARIEAGYSLWDLWRGDPRGLRVARITVAEADLDLRTALGEPEPEPERERECAAGGAFDFGSLEPLLRLCAGGASVHVAMLRLQAPQGERAGPLMLELRPGTEARELVASLAGVDLEVRMAAASPATAPITARVDVRDPGALLDLFGLGAGVRGGSMHAEVDVRGEPWRLDTRVDLTDLVHGGQRLASSHVVAHLDGGGLAVESASIDLPGVAAELRAVSVPGVFAGGADLWQGLTGRFAVRIDDLSDHAALLPASWRTLLPIRGELRGDAENGRLRLNPCHLTARGADLQIERGSFPLVSADWRVAEGSLRGTLTLDGFTQDLPWLGTTTANGRVVVTVSGSARAPHAAAEIDLGACRSARGSLAVARGTVRIDTDAIVAERLRVEDLRIAAVAGEASTHVTVDATCRLRDGEVDPDSLRTHIEASSAVLADLLAPHFAEAGFGPAPSGEATLELVARHDAGGLAIDALRLRTAASSPIRIDLVGEGVLPLHWSGAALRAVDAGEFVLRARVERPAAEALPALAFQGTLQLDARSASARELVVTMGEASVHGEIVAGQGFAALLDPAVDFAATALRGELSFDAVDLAALPASWFPGLALRGRLTGSLRAAGPAGRLEPEMHVSWTEGSLQGGGVPTLMDAAVRIELTPGEPAAPAMLLTATASASLAPEFAPDRAIALAFRLRCDENGTVLEPTTLKVGGGEVAIDLASNLRRADVRALLGGGGAIGDATLTGTIGLRAFSLAQLPSAWGGSGALRGVVEGDVVLDGTLASVAGPAIVRSGTLRVRDGEGKFGNLPRLEHVAAEVGFTPGELALRSFTGTLGAGRLESQGTLRARGASFAESWDDAALDFRLAGDDVLLYRADGTKVRATLNVTATGTLRAIAVAGDVELGRGSKFVRRLSLLPDLSARGGATAQQGFTLFEVPPPIGDRVTFDVAIQTREAFEVRTSVVDGDIEVAARLRGTAAAPRLEGNLSVQGGTLRFPGANLRIESGLLTFSPSEPSFPQLLLQAEGKRMGIAVSMAVSGRYDRPQVVLSSVPPLPPEDLVVLLSTGQLPSTLAGRGSEGQARFVGGYLAKEIFESYFGSDSTEKGSSAFDRLTIESGREVSKNGVESVLVEYELLPDFAVQAERDQHEDYNLGLVLRFRFR